MANQFDDWVERQRCFLCTRDAKVSFWSDYFIECARCGAYHFEPILTRTMEENDMQLLPYLSIHTREASDSGEPARLGEENWKKIALMAKAIPFTAKVKKFLAVAASRATTGHRVKFDPHTDAPLVYAVDTQQFGALWEHLFKSGYAAHGTLDGSFTLQGEAWALLEREAEDRPPVIKSRATDSPFVNAGRIQGLKALKNPSFDFAKLIRMCEELNTCFAQECYLAVPMLVRALLDHVAPIFRCKNFAEVANNYGGGGKSFKESMDRLDKSSRKIADSYLHQQIRKSESLPNETQVNFANDVDVLLGEIVRTLK